MSWPDYPTGFSASTALTLANFVQQAYFQLFVNAGTPPPPFGFSSYPLQMPPSDYALLYTIQGSESTPYDYFGYVVTGPSLINEGQPMVAFVLRGTESGTEWFDDIIDSSQTAFTGSGTTSLGLAHKGFTEIYSGFSYTNSNTGVSSETLATVMSALSTLYTTGYVPDLVITGHSLGGALATLMALDIAANQSISSFNNTLTCYTFGSPRVGDPATLVAAFNDYVTNGTIVSYRVANSLDVVPTLPPDVYYYTDILVDSPFKKYNYKTVKGLCPVDSILADLDFHSLNSYAAGLNNLINPPTSLQSPRPVRRRPATVSRPPIEAMPPGPRPAGPPNA